MGGAMGRGKPATAGYQRRAGTITLSCHFLKHLDTPAATASRCFCMLPLKEATMGAFLMLLSNSGPSRQPGAPMAAIAITLRSLNLACSFHMLCEYCTASHMAS